MFLGVDAGTSETKAVLVDRDGIVVAGATAPNRLRAPRPGWAEHDANEDWWANLCAVIGELLGQSGVSPTDIDAVACGGIGPCVLPVDEDGSPLAPAILYGIDTRAGEQIARLEAELGADAILERTGNALTSQSAGPKVAWLRDELAFKTAARQAIFEFLEMERGEGWWGDNSMSTYFADHERGANPFNWIVGHPLMDAEIISQYHFDHAGIGETSLMMELCPESVDMGYLSTEKWYLESAMDANRELGAKAVALILEQMRKLLS